MARVYTQRSVNNAVLIGFFAVTLADPVHGQICAEWAPELFLTPGIDGPVYTSTVYDDGTGPALYVAGEFTKAGGIRANNIARWNGAEWSPLGAGTNNSVHALAVYDDGSGPALYAGGWFTHAGGTLVNYIAKWNGQEWSPLGSGMIGFGCTVVSSLVVFDNGSGEALYAGGCFSSAGDAWRTAHIAKWDGQEWSTVDGTSTSTDSRGVNALAVYDDGYGSGPVLYAAGTFKINGVILIRRLGRLVGSDWLIVPSELIGSGASTRIWTLTVLDQNPGPVLIAGGWFRGVDGVAAENIAQWDGQSWAALGSGTDSTVHTVAVHDDGTGPALYAGGTFRDAGGVDVANVAKWDGANWSQLNERSSTGVVRASTLTSYDEGSGPRLFVGGEFFSRGNDYRHVENIARWDGIRWTPVGPGINCQSADRFCAPVVYELLTHDDGGGEMLFAGGIFEALGEQRAVGIAKWDGHAWRPVGDGTMIPTGFDPFIMGSAVFDDGTGPALYVSGNFGRIGGVGASHIAKWDGTTWSPFGGGISGIALDMEVHDDGNGPALYVAGNISLAGAMPVNNIAKWDGRRWLDVGGGMTGWGNALAVYDDGDGPALYVGGNFRSAGGVSSRNIAKWDGQAWHALADGLCCREVHGLAVYDEGAGPVLFAGGEFRFTLPDGTAVDYIARWDGSEWSAVADGFGGGILYRVYTLGTFDDGAGEALYVGGSLTTTGPWRRDGVARWDGHSWSFLAEGINGTVRAFASLADGDRQVLYAGGTFEEAGGAPSFSVAKWYGCSADCGGPSIDLHPSNRTVNTCESLMFEVFSPDPEVYYRWRKDGKNLSDDDRISGSTTETLIITNAQTSDRGSYDCVVRDPAHECPTVSAAAILEVIDVPNCCATDLQCEKCETCDVATHTCNRDVPNCCSSDAQCDDGDPCTDDFCIPMTNVCRNTNMCGACCLPDRTCGEDFREEDCLALSGPHNFLGINSLCRGEGKDCLPAPTVSEWGMAILAALLLIGLTVKFRRRWGFGGHTPYLSWR
ncbi:MAG: IPTL-CTERM sorting domain-containing protein [Phycisphaerae bacterium]